MSTELGFAVVDVETTGFSPRLHDRIVEIAIVRVDASGVTEDEWVTLVNPERDVGPTYVHGITASDVIDAPVFDDIAGDVVNRLNQAVLVAHNVRFDRGFLSAELTLTGIMLPEIPALCTLELAHKLYPRQTNHKLATCCEAVGAATAPNHSALEDARACASLLNSYLEAGHHRGWNSLAEIGCAPLPFPEQGWPVFPGGGPRRLRGERTASAGVPFLARMVASLDARSAGAHLGPYLDLLDRVLEDRLVTEEEATALHETALEWGLTREEALESHHIYLEMLIDAAMADGSVSESERHDLQTVAGLLAVDASLLEALVVEAKGRGPTVATPHDALTGKSVCFTGSLNGRLEGQAITREIARDLALDAGLLVAERVTKDLDLLVVADPNTQSGKAKLARKFGTRIMAEAAFWRAIGSSVE